MKLPKSKLGFLLAGAYVFVVGLFFLYARFACNTDALYCGFLALTPILPTLFIFEWIISLLSITTPIVGFITVFLMAVVLLYLIGAGIQKFSLKITRVVSIAVIIIVIGITGILGVRYFNKSDIWKLDNVTNVENSVKGRIYCQQDSDCILVPQYQGCCTKGCEIEAVNVEAKNKEVESGNKICSTKDYSCPKYNCKPHNNQAVCEQNRCVVREKASTNLPKNDLPIIQIEHQGNTYTGEQGSFCWPTAGGGEGGGGSALCADIVFPNPSEIISITRGDALIVKTEAYEQPERLQAQIYLAYDDIKPKKITLTPGLKSEFNFDMQPGVYILQIFGNWPVGDISYGFKIEVKEKCGPEPPALCAEGASLTCLDGRWECRKIIEPQNQSNVPIDFLDSTKTTFVDISNDTLIKNQKIRIEKIYYCKLGGKCPPPPIVFEGNTNEKGETLIAYEVLDIPKFNLFINGYQSATVSHGCIMVGNIPCAKRNPETILLKYYNNSEEFEYKKENVVIKLYPL